MKWNKVKKYSKPITMVLIRMEIKDIILYGMGYFRENGCFLFGSEFRYFTEDQLQTYNAHYIYPQDLEMPE